MPRSPSPETQLRSARAELRRLSAALVGMTRERDTLRGQLTEARQETAEWKRRFDALLARDASPTASKIQEGDK